MSENILPKCNVRKKNVAQFLEIYFLGSVPTRVLYELSHQHSSLSTINRLRKFTLNLKFLI